MAFKIYRSHDDSGVVIFDPTTLSSKIGATLHATLDEITRTTINIYDLTTTDISGNYPGQRLMINLLPADVLDENGNVVSADLHTVINYLNSEFKNVSRLVAKPTVTSSLAANAITGEGFNYKIETLPGDHPTLFSADSLPSGLYCDLATGIIVGSTTAVGVHNVTLNAVNVYGTTSANLTLTVLNGVGFSNTKCIEFLREYQHYLRIQPAGALGLAPGSAFTWSCWVKRTYPYDHEMYLMVNTPIDFVVGPFAQGWALEIEIGGKVSLRGGTLEDAAGTENSVVKTSTNVVFPNTTDWHHIAATYDGSLPFDPVKIKLYIDGVLDATATVASVGSWNLAAWSNPALSSLFIGRGRNDILFQPETWLGARLDEISVWSAVLTAGNVTTLYNAGVPANLALHPAFGSCLAWWRMGDGDTHPVVSDQIAAFDLAMINMTAARIVNDTP